MVLYPSIKSGSLTDQEVAVLSGLITSGQLSSGEYLPSEAELSRRLGVSRPTVQNQVLVSLAHAICGLRRDAIASTYAVNDRTDVRLDPTRVLEAVIARNPAAAEAAMQAHLRPTEKMLSLWSRLPEHVYSGR